jgi:exoribonuclease R
MTSKFLDTYTALHSIFPCLPSSRESKLVNSIKVTSMQINTTTSRFATNTSAHANADFFQGTVPVPAFTKPVLLVGRENMNRAVQGDVVVVEVFDEREWKAPADEVIDQEGKSA